MINKKIKSPSNPFESLFGTIGEWEIIISNYDLGLTVPWIKIPTKNLKYNEKGRKKIE